MLKTMVGAVIGEVIGRKSGNGLLGAGLGIVATRLATRSIPACCSLAVHLRPKACMTNARNASVADPLSSVTTALPS
jgi:hypothetical protein